MYILRIKDGNKLYRYTAQGWVIHSPRAPVALALSWSRACAIVTRCPAPIALAKLVDNKQPQGLSIVKIF